MVDAQYCIAIMGGREVSRPYQVLFLCPQFLSTEPFLNYDLCLFLGRGIEEGVVEKLCLNLSTTPNRLTIQ